MGTARGDCPSPARDPQVWDTKVALQRAYAAERLAAMSERFEMQSKVLRKLMSIKPRALSTGAMSALRRGVAVVDDAGFLRCPPGTPNAMEFTDFRGSNCGVGGAAKKPVRLSIGDEASRAQLSRQGIGVLSAVDVAANRIGAGAVRAPKGDRRRLVEAVRQFTTRREPGAEPSGWQKAFRLLTIPNEGFSLDIDLGENATSGYAIARPGRGIRIKASELLDENGDIKDEGALRLARMIAANADDFTKPAEVTVNGRTYRAEKVVLGAWRSTEDEYVYFDVSDVFPQDMDVQDALDIGRDRNQQSIANLAKIAEENAVRYKMRDDGVSEEEIPGISWVDTDEAMNGAEGALLGTGGSGADLLPEQELMGVNPVRLFSEGGELEGVLRTIEGTGTLDLENFTPEQVATMLRYLKNAPGFGWIEPDNPDHLYFALMQLSDNLMNLMGDTTKEFRDRERRWYDIANEFNKRIAAETGMPEHVVHAITARFSPQKDWDQNTAMSEHATKLLGDEDYTVDAAVGERAYGFALHHWKQRNGTGRGSHANRIKAAQKDLDAARKAADKAEKRVAKHSARKQTPAAVRDLAKAEVSLAAERERLAKAEFAYGKVIEARDADVKPTLDSIVGKKMADLNIDNAAAVLRAHSELEGGAYLGQPLAELSKDAKKKGASPRGLLAYITNITPDAENPGDHTVVGNPKSRVRSQSMDVYRSVVAIYRSGGDMAIIDYELGEGSKVRSFNNNNAAPNDVVHRDLTIDTHAVAAELGIPIAAAHDLTNLAFQNVTSLGTGQAYPLMRAAMIATAIRWKEMTGEDYLPREIQSITWVKMRELVPAKAKKFIVDRAAQIQRLGGGPNGDPRFKGAAGYEALKRLYEAATVDLKTLNKGRRPKDHFTRNGLINAVVLELGLPPLTAADKLKKAKKGSAAAKEAAAG